MSRRFTAIRRAFVALFAASLIGVARADAPLRETPKEVVVRDLDGNKRVAPDPKKRATVLIFITHDCPICNIYAPEINRIRDAFEPKGVAFFIVYAENNFSVAQVRKHAADYAIRGPIVLEDAPKLARMTRATVTPEAIVLSPTGKTLYDGRIDDLYLDFGKSRYKADTHDLRDALSAILAGKPVPHPTTKAVGCYISLK